MTKLVLIIPPSPWLISDIDLPMLGPLYISSYLQQHNFSVQVCDLSGLKECDWKIPVGDYYGISGTSPNFPQIKRIVEILKTRDFESFVIVGGAHATTFPSHILNKTKADICVIGEGECTILDILQKKPLNDISGIAFKTNNDVITTNQRELIQNLDIIPPPDLDAIDFYKYSRSQTFKYLLGECKEATILTSRGCPYNCNFCAQSMIWQGKVRNHSIERVISEVKNLKNKYKVDLIYMLDDTFVINKHRVKKFCEQIKPLNLHWHCLNRVDSTEYATIKDMKNSGCVQVVFGFESGSNHMLNLMNKRTTVQQAYKAIDICKQLGIKVRGQMIVGFPGETDTTVEETAQFIRNAESVTTFGIHVFQPFPGCAVWNNPQRYNFNLNKETQFEEYHTIGKSDFVPSDPKLKEWFLYLKGVAASKNIEEKVK